MNRATIGIFVGGASSRMGSPKGRLVYEGAPLLERMVASCGGLPCRLIGDATPYADLVPAVPRLADTVVGVGPIGGLDALLAEATTAYAVSVGCDMPFVTAETLAALVHDPRDCPVLSARADDDSPFEPMLTRWSVSVMRDAVRAAITRGEYGLQKLIRAHDAERFVPEDARAILDWDTPADVLAKR